MKKLIFVSVVFASMFYSCDEDCIVGRSNYTLELNIAGEDRKAIIVRPVNECIKSPVLFYFHGRGGTAKNSQAGLKLHNISLLNNMFIVYTEGTNYDNRPVPTNAWVIRFPHISTECRLKNKDLAYVQAIIDHLDQNENADISRMGASGHSNGGFFTLSLAELWPDKFMGFASHGSYSSYAPSSSLIDCDNSYVNAIDKSNATTNNANITINPAPTLYMFGVWDSTLHSNVPAVYKADCKEFSYFQNAVLQLCIKNNSEMPDCDSKNFMTTFSRQTFPALQGGAETQVQVHMGNHSWPSEANTWIAEFFADLLYY